jgi:subtilisin family serine protease
MLYRSFRKLLFVPLFLSYSFVFSQSAEKLQTLPNWFNLDPTTDKINGISTEKAYQLLLKDKKSSPVLVAIIDSGVEIDHEDLKGKIWVNEKEIPNNGIDDDKNGYIDDINGWDFLGNAKGEDLTYETLELTRELIKYTHLIEPIDALNANKEEKVVLNKYKSLKAKYDQKVEEIEKQNGKNYIQLYDNYMSAKELIKTEFKVEEVTPEILDKINLISSDRLQKAKRIYQFVEEIGLNEDKLDEAYDYFNTLINYSLNEDYNGRSIIGDSLANLNEKGYGNNEVEGPDAKHGTHVAGIIGANRSNEIGINGIAENVKLMVIRAVPNGDERDKDIANAIRYAVDNGARVINMSFGKPFSPDKEQVDQAVKFAESKGVLLVHAAGNESEDTDVETYFPTKKYGKDLAQCKTWIEVGAASWKTGEETVASFSNYGKSSVDVFAPGEDIYSSVVNGKYKEMSGTSMAAPVVTGLAALMLSYYPNLSGQQLKDIILSSVNKINDTQVNVPGKTTTTNFKNLSVTGGIVNAYNALVMASKTIN